MFINYANNKYSRLINNKHLHSLIILDKPFNINKYVCDIELLSKILYDDILNINEHFKSFNTISICGEHLKQEIYGLCKIYNGDLVNTCKAYFNDEKIDMLNKEN